ncbi:MAG: protein kinase domain-containing protein [Pseudomonadota bacterium]|uniref:protein kinase domain-containing protein n=1 Tax=Sulfuricystis thermophila TaxID=2496847 RepID=UPI00103585EF|nr:protein kinase [Sulfuricystis thermophila]
MSQAAHALPPGTLLHEYRIDGVLGVGAFGITYRGWDTHLNIPVAIKEYFPADLAIRKGERVTLKSAADEELYHFGLEAFVSEARILARLKHPNIVRISRYFNAHGTAYFVMDYEEGTTLAMIARSRKEGFDETWLRGIFVPLLEGLRAIHAQKYLHRDIKPGNIYIRQDGVPLLIDFGAAKLEFGAATNYGYCALTPGYAPLEQYEDGGVQGPWSDLYALGATLRRCITGKRPVDAKTRLLAVEQGLPDPMAPLAKIAAGRYSSGFLEIIDSLLALRPEQRPASVGAVLAQLETGEAAGAVTSTIVPYVPRQHMRNHKILFIGPVGVGKTTAIGALSDVPVVGTDQTASDMTRSRKEKTTVAFDYGIMNIGPNERVHLYGAPGQERFDFMWEILKKGVLGLVILIDNSRPSPLDDLAFYLKWCADAVGSATKIVIGVNFMALDQPHDLESYYRFLLDEARVPKIKPPVFEIDARNKTDVVMLIQALLVTIDPGVQDYEL